MSNIMDVVNFAKVACPYCPRAAVCLSTHHLTFANGHVEITARADIIEVVCYRRRGECKFTLARKRLSTPAELELLRCRALYQRKKKHYKLVTRRVRRNVRKDKKKGRYYGRVREGYYAT